MAGIENVKEMVDFGLSVGEGIAGLVEDGVGLKDIVKLVEILKEAPAAFKDAGAIFPELKDLDDAEKAELKQFVVDEFDIDNDAAEAAIESALGMVVDLASLLKLFKGSDEIVHPIGG